MIRKMFFAAVAVSSFCFARGQESGPVETVMWFNNSWQASSGASGLEVTLGGKDWRPAAYNVDAKSLRWTGRQWVPPDTEDKKLVKLTWDGEKWEASTKSRLPIKVMRRYRDGLKEWEPPQFADLTPRESPTTELRIATLKVGQVGTFAKSVVGYRTGSVNRGDGVVVQMATPINEKYVVKVFSIIDETNMLVADPGGKVAWVANYSTNDLVDGEAIVLSGAWKVTGTKSYEAAFGKRTVHLIEPHKDITNSLP